MFRFKVLSSKDKKKYIRHKVFIFTLLILATIIAINVTNLEMIEEGSEINVTMGATVGLVIFLFAVTNRLKTLFKIKFVTFIIMWILLLSLRSIIDTAIWTFGLTAIPLAIDDLIIIPYWDKLWYNNYER